jgi:hypothetical protein
VSPQLDDILRTSLPRTHWLYRDKQKDAVARLTQDVHEKDGPIENNGLPLNPADVVGDMVAASPVGEKIGDGLAWLTEKLGADPLLTALLLGTVVNAKGKTVPGDTRKSGGKTVYVPAESSVARVAESMANAKNPTKEAAAKLKWQEWDRPYLEDLYGDLRPGRYSDPKKRRMQNTPAEVEKRVQETRDFLKRPTDIWVPEDYGIFDRRLIQDALEGFPDVEQHRFPRSRATGRADMSYVDEMYEDPITRELIKGQILKGLPLGGETFYASLYPLKVELMQRGYPAQVFNDWAWQTAQGSARNSIYNEQAVGNFLRGLDKRGVPLSDANVKRAMAEFKQRYGQGLPLLPVHREGVRRVIDGLTPEHVLLNNLTEHYKIPTYAMQKSGDFRYSFTGDTHEAAGQSRASRYHPYFSEAGGFTKNEYGPAERHFGSIAEDTGGLPWGMAQAGRWFGGGPLTGLVSPRGDALDVLERQAAYTMHNMGLSTDPASVRKFIVDLVVNGGELSPWASKAPMPDFRTRATTRKR